MQLKDKFNIDEFLAEPNIATLLCDADLDAIGMQVVKDFDIDLQSRSTWEKRTEASLKLALQVAESKNFPWANASNIKFPLLTIAALQYHARSYPVLVNGDSPVRCRVYGDDPDGTKTARATRVEDHMSYQLLEEDEDWESEMDKVLITQPIVGCAFKKTYFDHIKKHNISENVLAKDLVVNYWTKSLDTAPRVSHVLQMQRNEIYERVVRGLWLEGVDEGRAQPGGSNTITTNLQAAQDKAQGLTPPEPNDSSTPIEIIEQHCFIDFDDDGYAEPYIVYVRRDNKKVARIVARFMRDNIERNDKKQVMSIKAEQYFTKYPFVPSPDGGFYDLGFGVLLGPLNESINTIINQLVDAGTMSNTAGGFLSRGIKLRGGNQAFTPLEWKHVDTTGDDLRKGIVPLPVREPSQVLFTLLGMLINYGERIGGSVDILTGQNPGQNTPAETTRTMAEQGMKIFNGIFKRTYRSLKQEFKKIYRLNQLYLDDAKEYYSDNGNSQFVLAKDYQSKNNDVCPSADPNIVSDSQRMTQAQAVLHLATTTPGVNIYEAQKTYLKALKVTNLDVILPDPKGPNAIKPTPNPKVVVEGMKIQDKQEERKLRHQEMVMSLMGDAELNQAKIKKLEADAIRAVAEAGGVQSGHEIAFINAQIAAEKNHRDHLADVMKLVHDLEKERSNPNQ